MRLLLATRSTLRHQMGGFERQTWDLATRLAERGNEAAFLTTPLPGAAESPLPLHTVGAGAGKLDRAWWRESAKWMHAHRDEWDAVLSAGHAGATLRDARFLAFQCHGVRLHEKARVGADGTLRPDWRRLGKWDYACVRREVQLLRRCDAVVSIGPVPSAALRWAPYRWALGRREPVQIPNGVDERRFHPDPAAGKAWRAARGIAEDATVVLTVTRLVPHKGVAEALRAFARWSAGDPGARHVVVGAGPERPALEAEARRLGVAERVLFTGPVPDAELPAAYQAADVFLFLPTGSEGHPLNVLEALGCGLPVVAPPHAIDATHPRERMFAASATAISEALRAPRAKGRACQLPPHLTLDGCAAAYERVLAKGAFK